MMKKSVKFVILMLFILLGMLVVGESASAIDFNLGYSKDANSSTSNNFKVKPGEEVWISFDISNDSDEKVMAIYGSIQYDKNVLELVESENNSNSAIIEFGDGWVIGDVSKQQSDDNSDKETAKIMFYTTEEDRSSTIAYVKFKVKDNITVNSTEVKVTDVVLYNTTYKEIQDSLGDVTINVKIYQASSIVAVVTILIIIAILILCIVSIIFKKNINKANSSNLKNENNENKIEDINNSSSSEEKSTEKTIDKEDDDIEQKDSDKKE